MNARGWFGGRGRGDLGPALEAARNAAEAAVALQHLLDHFEGVAEARQRIKDLELKGDRTAQAVYERAQRRAGGPDGMLPRLMRHLDDIVDVIYAAVNRLYLYHVTKPTPPMRRFADIVRQQSHELALALAELGNPEKRKRATARCAEVKRLETEADKLLNQSLADLFKGTDAVALVKYKDIYELLEAASDKCEDAANAILDLAR